MAQDDFVDNGFPLQVEIDEEDPSEKARKQIARKRIFFLLFGIVVLLIGIVIFEIVELSLGGRL